MAKLNNEIIINAPVDKIWNVLIDLEALEKYDPTVKKSTLISSQKSGIGASRKVIMADGKNWFEEKIIKLETNQSLEIALTACSFPIHKLRHSYFFEEIGNQTKLKQEMQYLVKFGLLGRFLDLLFIKKQSQKGIQKFLVGLKHFVEV